MRRILLPLEQTERSLKALQYFKTHYSASDVGVVLLMVDESLPYTATTEDESRALAELEGKLKLIRKFLEEYDVICKAAVGKAGPRIVKLAREYGVSFVAMTKSSKPDMLNQIGRTAEYVLLNAPCNVLIVNESSNSDEYRGLVYSTPQGVVNLRGQIGNKQSECMLPSAAMDCEYRFKVTVGKVRFFHTAYNPETRKWDMPPVGDQKACVDIVAGEEVSIFVKAGSVDGKADRIRVANRGIREEAVFEYKILSEETAPAEPQTGTEDTAKTGQEVFEASQAANNGFADATDMTATGTNDSGIIVPAMVEPDKDLGVVYEKPTWDVDAYYAEIFGTNIEDYNLLADFQSDIGYVSAPTEEISDAIADGVVSEVTAETDMETIAEETTEASAEAE